MSKSFTSLVIFLFLIGVFGFACKRSPAKSTDYPKKRARPVATQTPVPQGCKPCKRGNGKVNESPSVDSVTLGDSVITLACPSGTRSKSGNCDDNKSISVAIKASDPEDDILTYNYSVSGGRVIGTGANVTWDLSGAQPGTYTITTGVDDGCGVCGKSDTKTIRVEECSDCERPCFCSALAMSGPSSLTNPGDTMTFTASVSGDVTYNWSVSAGTIESGQGTPSITVRTSRDMAGTNVTATVDIGGLPEACHCPTTQSESAAVAPMASPTFGSIEGLVIGNDGRPVAGASVTINPPKAPRVFTDANGVYRFNNIPAGTSYIVTAVRGNVSNSVEVGVVPAVIVPAGPIRLN